MRDKLKEVSKIRIGADPGATGGIVVDIDGERMSYIMPRTSKKVLYTKVFLAIFENLPPCEDVHVVIEDVHSIYGASAGSNFNFGFNCGFLEGVISTFQIPYTKVAPKSWQKELWVGIPVIEKQGKKDTKGMSLIAAKRLFPKENFLASPRCKVPHDGIVDAMLICEYCKRKF
jgi:hypothetical protein